ncbi:hypothetical protein [Bartonella sp. AA168HLJHH]|uniref:hypothetical protein n=1 Tax=Bartonella sp. AA168HLJHH TaxID=3243427 RepID=UPI0035D0EEBD
MFRHIGTRGGLWGAFVLSAGGERRNDGPKCFFIAVTMVHVMLSSRGCAAWEGLS